MTTITNRYDFALIFEVVNGNPNGDPDAGNLPRLDPETNRGLVTDVSLKRKIRNYVDLAHHGQDGFHIYVEEGAILNDKHRQAYRALRPDDAKVDKDAKLNPKDDAEAKKLTAFMCGNFFDVRTFGAVMSTGVNCGQVKGPVQMSFARSVEPIMPLEISITRMHIVPYGLYVAHGFVSAKFAERTGFSDADLDLLFEALGSMFEHDRSAARGEMATRKLVVFKHDNALGNAPAHSLFERIRIGRNVDGAFRTIDSRLDNLPPARAFSDYIVAIDRDALPAGVEIIEKL